MGQHREQPRAVPRLTVLGIAERLLAGAAVVGATIYVLINGLYIEFYDDFGVRPEDVGLDRLAILGRSAWVALVAIALVGLVGYINAMASAEARIRAARPRPEANPKHGGRSLSEQQRLRRLVITPISLAIASLLMAGLVIILFGRFNVRSRTRSTASGRARPSTASASWCHSSMSAPPAPRSPGLATSSGSPWRFDLPTSCT